MKYRRRGDGRERIKPTRTYFPHRRIALWTKHHKISTAVLLSSIFPAGIGAPDLHVTGPKTGIGFSGG